MCLFLLALLCNQTYEGGLGGEPGNEAHGGYTYCGLAAMALAGQLDALDLPRLTRWAVQRQGSLEGGFNGRTNKLVDGCYSFWQGGLFPLLQRLAPQHLVAASAATVPLPPGLVGTAIEALTSMPGTRTMVVSCVVEAVAEAVDAEHHGLTCVHYQLACSYAARISAELVPHLPSRGPTPACGAGGGCLLNPVQVAWAEAGRTQHVPDHTAGLSWARL